MEGMMPKDVTIVKRTIRSLVQGAGASLVINGKKERRYACVACEWQGGFLETKVGKCPDCDGNVELIED